MAETSYIIQNGRRLDLKDASARKSIADLYQKIGGTQGRNIFISTEEPTEEDGNNGDIWILYSE